MRTLLMATFAACIAASPAPCFAQRGGHGGGFHGMAGGMRGVSHAGGGHGWRAGGYRYGGAHRGGFYYGLGLGFGGLGYGYGLGYGFGGWGYGGFAPWFDYYPGFIYSTQGDDDTGDVLGPAPPARDPWLQESEAENGAPAGQPCGRWSWRADTSSYVWDRTGCSPTAAR